jgi:hypothetical protein
VSALFILRTVIPQQTDPRTAGPAVGAAVRDLAEGWRHLRGEPRIGRIALTKPAWALGGAALVYMLALVGEDLVPGAPAVGIGLLYAARGLGTGIGPIAARALFPDERTWPRLIGWGIVASGLIYVAVGQLPWTYFTIALVVGAHTPSGANWVTSTVMLQRRTADRFRGRVFAAEWLLLTGINTLTIGAGSLLLEYGGWSLRAGMGLFAAVQILCGLAWLLRVVPAERRATPPPSPAPGAAPGRRRSPR